MAGCATGVDDGAVAPAVAHVVALLAAVVAAVAAVVVQSSVRMQSSVRSLNIVAAAAVVATHETALARGCAEVRHCGCCAFDQKALQKAWPAHKSPGRWAWTGVFVGGGAHGGCSRSPQRVPDAAMGSRMLLPERQVLWVCEGREESHKAWPAVVIGEILGRVGGRAPDQMPARSAGVAEIQVKWRQFQGCVGVWRSDRRLGSHMKADS